MYASPRLGRTGRRRDYSLATTSREPRNSSTKNLSQFGSGRFGASPTEIPRSRSPRRRPYNTLKEDTSLGALPRYSPSMVLPEGRKREHKSTLGLDSHSSTGADSTQWKLDKLRLERAIEKKATKYETMKQRADNLTAEIETLGLDTKTVRRSPRRSLSPPAGASYANEKYATIGHYQPSRSPRRSPRANRAERARSAELPPEVFRATLSEAIEREMHLLKNADLLLRKYNRERDYYEGTLQDQFVKERALQNELRDEREQNLKLQIQLSELQKLAMASESTHRQLRFNLEDLIRKNEELERTIELGVVAENRKLKDENKAISILYDREVQQLKYKIQVATADLSKKLTEVDNLRDDNAELNRKLQVSRETIELLEKEKSDSKFSIDMSKRLLEDEAATAKSQKELIKMERDNDREIIREIQTKLEEKQKLLDTTQSKLAELHEKNWDLETSLKQAELTTRESKIVRQVVQLEDVESVLSYIEGKLLGPDNKEFEEVQKKRLARRIETIVGPSSRFERYFDSIDSLIDNKAALLNKILENGFDIHNSILEVFRAKAEKENQIRLEEQQKTLKEMSSKPDEARFYTLRSSKETILRLVENQIELWTRSVKAEKESETEKKLDEVLAFSAQLNQIAASGIRRNEKFQKATSQLKEIQKTRARELGSPRKAKASAETLENTLELYQNQQIELAQLFYGISHRLKQLLTGSGSVGRDKAFREFEAEISPFWTAEDAFLRKFDNLLATLRY